MDYLTLLSIVAFSIVFASHVQPLQYFKDKLGLLPNSKLYSQYILINIIIKTFRKLLNCSGCISFWTTLIVLNPSLLSFKLGLIIYCVTLFLETKINQINL